MIFLFVETGMHLVHQNGHMIGHLYFPALYTGTIVFTHLSNTTAEAVISTHLISAAFFTTLIVTLWTTFLIAYHIYSTSHLIPNQKKPRFYNILEMIAQSSFVYSLALLPNAVIGTITTTQSNYAILTTVSNYLMTVLLAITVCRAPLHYTSWDTHIV